MPHNRQPQADNLSQQILDTSIITIISRDQTTSQIGIIDLDKHISQDAS
jgi:hypothetical protein